MCSRLSETVIAVLLLFAGALPAAAGFRPDTEERDTLRMDMEQLFGMGTGQNLEVAAGRLREMMAQERLGTSRRDALPDISLSLSGGLPDTDSWRQYSSISLSQPLYQGGKIRHSVRKAGIESRITFLETEEERADIRLSLLDNYLTLLNLYRQQHVLDRNIRESERRLRDIIRMKEEGLITNNDVLRSEMQLTENRLATQETRNNIRIISRRMDILLGMDENLIIMPDSSLSDTCLQILSYEEYMKEAEAGEPGYLALAEKTELARNGISLLRSETVPRISLISDCFIHSWSVGLSVTYPISSLYKYRSRINEARANVRLQENAQRQKLQQLGSDISTALIRHNEAVNRVHALELSVRQAEENYRIMRNRYMNQLAILTDLLDADNLRLNAELQLTEAKTKVILTYYQLQRAAGKL